TSTLFPYTTLFRSHGPVAPAEDGQAFFGGDGLDAGDGCGAVGLAGGQERDAGGVGAGFGQVEAGGGAVELVGDLGEDPGAVAVVGVGAGGAAVVEVAQDGEGLVHGVVGASAGEVRDEADAAGVVLEGTVVEALVGAGAGRRVVGEFCVSAVGRTLRVASRHLPSCRGADGLRGKRIRDDIGPAAVCSIRLCPAAAPGRAGVRPLRAVQGVHVLVVTAAERASTGPLG